MQWEEKRKMHCFVCSLGRLLMAKLLSEQASTNINREMRGENVLLHLKNNVKDNK